MSAAKLQEVHLQQHKEMLKRVQEIRCYHLLLFLRGNSMLLSIVIILYFQKTFMSPSANANINSTVYPIGILKLRLMRAEQTWRLPSHQVFYSIFFKLIHLAALIGVT